MRTDETVYTYMIDNKINRTKYNCFSEAKVVENFNFHPD